MPNLQELDNSQIDEVVRSAVDKQIPVSLTCRKDNGWVIFHSRFVGLEGQHILLQQPWVDGGDLHELRAADRVGLSFKLRHHKHICLVTVAGSPGDAASPPPDADILTIVSPTRMQRLQRRVYQRVAIPQTRIVRASFWLGGRDAEPTGTSAEIAVWTGTVDNLSAGGFQMSCRNYTGPQLQVGDAIGVQLTFGLGQENCLVDAQFRHMEHRDGVTYLGFQFVALAQSRQGRAALQLISARVSEFQRMQEGHGRHRVAS